MFDDRVTVKQLNDHLWLLDDNHEATGYLIAGREKALVIDTMNGFANVHAIAKRCTDKPVLVVNTHGHSDHIYGNVWFDGAMIDEKDLELARQCCSDPRFIQACEEYGVHMPPFTAVRDGDIIDLGGLTAEVIGLPGHTPGGICLLLREDRILFTGDGINRHLWMQLEESLSLREALADMDRIAFVKERADKILHGHAQGFEDISLFDELREGLRTLVEQNGCEVTDTDAEYTWYGGTALQHRFAENSVIVYTRSKLNTVDMAPEFAAIDSFCGIDCSACEFKKAGQCGGCTATKGRPFHMRNGETCALAQCCMQKGIRWCADCAGVACEQLKKFSDDPQHGDHPAGARIERLKALKKELLAKARQGQKQIAVCGFTCGEHCFLGEGCGWCASGYNCCSYATVMPDGICENMRCVREKGIEGCRQCPELLRCEKGFYGNTAEPEAVRLAKAGALFTAKYGETMFLGLQNYLLKEKGVRYTDYITDKSSIEKILEALEKEY